MLIFAKNPFSVVLLQFQALSLLVSIVYLLHPDGILRYEDVLHIVFWALIRNWASNWAWIGWAADFDVKTCKLVFLVVFVPY